MTSFLSFLNDLGKHISSIPKLFADDGSLFSIDDDVNVSVVQINDDLFEISKWGYQWKTSFNLDV